MRLTWLICFSLLCAAAPARAAAVDLGGVLREALSARPFAAAARQEAEGAWAAVGEARSRYLPRLTLSESFLATDEPGGSLFVSLNQEELELSPTADPYNHPPSRRDFETRLQLDQPLYDPDIAYGLRRAQKRAEAAEAFAVWSREEAAFAAFAAYLEVQRSGTALVWAESSRREAEEIVRLATRRHAEGVGLKADVLRARVQLAEAERRRVSAANDLAVARLALGLTMGRDEGVDIAAPLSPESLGEGDLPSRRGDLQARALGTEEAALALCQSRAAYLPRLGVSAAYTLHDGAAPFGTDAGSWSVRAALSWELFDGGRRSNTVARAAAEKGGAASRLLEAERQARFASAEAELRAGEARSHLATARQAVAEAEEGQRLLGRRYEAGLANLADLLGAQTALDRARLDLAAAESRHLLALGNIRMQSGNFLKTVFPSGEEKNE